MREDGAPMEDRAGATRVDLMELAAAGGEARAGGQTGGVVWKLGAADRDLDVNLVQLPPGGNVGSHVNEEVDVLLFGVAGGAEVACDAERHRLAPGVLVWLPRRSQRWVAAGEDGAAYLSAHRRRAGVTIEPRPVVPVGGKVRGDPAAGTGQAGGQQAEQAEGGDPACWAGLVCRECGAVISEGHRSGCRGGAEPGGGRE